MHKLFLCVVACAHVAYNMPVRQSAAHQNRQTSVTIFNKSKEQIVVSFAAGATKLVAKEILKPRQSKKILVRLHEQQLYALTIEQRDAYWPQVFEMKLMAPGQLVLKRDSLVVSTKFSKKRALCASPIKIGYFGKSRLGGQEIEFISDNKKPRY